MTIEKHLARPPVHVIGMGLSFRDLTQAHLDLIRQARVMVGGKRHLAPFRHVPALFREISGPIHEVVRFIKDHLNQPPVVVLASGDPLFFGIGKTLIDHLGPENVAVYPNITSMAAAFSRLKLPWQDAAWVSLHGENNVSGLQQALAEKELVCVLTDPDHGPALIAALPQIQDPSWDLWVLERMGTDSENIIKIPPGKAGDRDYGQPNVVVLQKKEMPEPPGPLCLGTPDHWFLHEKGLITKAPVRALSLSLLRLEPADIVWDLGAGSGSVALEASLLAPLGRIFAVEKNPARVTQIEANARRFQVKNLKAVQLDMPQGLEHLPRPGKVFVGGGGKAMRQILEKAVDALMPGGRIAVNAVLLETLHQAASLLEALRLDIAVTQLQVSQSRNMPWDRRMEALNPVWIIAGQKGA